MPVFLTQEQFAPWLSGEAGAEYLKPAPNDYLQRWPVSKRVKGSKANPDDATLIAKVELAAPEQDTRSGFYKSLPQLVRFPDGVGVSGMGYRPDQA
jgi:hypothetical protein